MDSVALRFLGRSRGSVKILCMGHDDDADPLYC